VPSLGFGPRGRCSRVTVVGGDLSVVLSGRRTPAPVQLSCLDRGSGNIEVAGYRDAEVAPAPRGRRGWAGAPRGSVEPVAGAERGSHRRWHSPYPSA